MNRNYKPSGSDLEDDDEDDSDDDPANWFEDENEHDKFQNIVEPDMEERSQVVRIDGDYPVHNPELQWQ